MSVADPQHLRALCRRPGWIFDMDGTLTIAAHDFDAIRVELELPAGRPILESLALLDPREAAPKHRRLAEIEAEIALDSRPAAGAAEFLEALRSAGHRLGVVTRNTRANANITLRAAGLADFFEGEDVLGRDEAPPKPDPGALVLLLGRWSLPPERAVMVGDYKFDLAAGRAAGTATVHVDVTGRFEFGGLADAGVRSLAQLAEAFSDPVASVP